MHWLQVEYSEEVMREGFGIEDVNIPLSDKVALLHALSDTGLKRITVGAFVSPRFVPQMACFEALLRSFEPRPDVAYLTFLHNEKAREQALRFSPPLTVEDGVCTLFVDICDVHQRRNLNRSIEQIMAAWPEVVDGARRRGVTTARAGIASAWGSNFLGPFSRSCRMEFLARQIDFLHGAGGMALPSIYAALRTLDVGDTVLLEGTLGGIGGGQYCGNGAASGMAPTEDLMHMLEGMGIATGVNLGKLIECVWLLERIIGKPSYGHVSKAGPRPTEASRFYDPNLPAVESLKAARHFMVGPLAYEGETYSPWRHPIAGPWYPGSEERTPAQSTDGHLMEHPRWT